MKALGLFAIGVVALLGAVAIARGGDKDAPPIAGGPPDNDNVSGIRPADGMVAPNTFLTFEGKRYELVNLFEVDRASRDQFQHIGVAAESDIDFGGQLAVYKRDGESTSVYTLNPETPDDPPFWMQWRVRS